MSYKIIFLLVVFFHIYVFFLKTFAYLSTFSSLHSIPRAFLILGNSLVCTFLLLDLVLHVADFLELLLEVDKKFNMIVMWLHSSLDAFVEVLIAGVFVEVIKWKVRAGTRGGCF